MSYAWKDISPQDQYQIIDQRPLSYRQDQVLQLLYQPLIGQASLSLYRFFNDGHQEGQVKKLSYLLSMLKVGIPDFYQSRIRLEGIALIESYQKDHDYVFKIKAPLDADLFFKDQILSNLLIEEVGEPTYQQLKDFFQSEHVDLESYEPISKSFLDVFHYSSRVEEKIKEAQPTESSQQVKARIEAEESTFNWDLFLESMKSHFVNRSSLLNPQAKETILFLHECYGLDELDMQKAVIMSTQSGSGDLSLEDLTRQVRDKYQPARKSTALQRADSPGQDSSRTQSSKQDVSQSFTADEQGLLEAARMNSPIAFIQSIKEQKGGYVTQDEKYILEEIVKKSNLKSEVINIMIHYILVVKNNDTIHKNFANQIANNWAQNKVQTAEQAIHYTRQVNQDAGKKRKKAYPAKSKTWARKEKLPDWAKDGNQKTKTDQPLSQDLQESFAKRRMNFAKYGNEKEGE